MYKQPLILNVASYSCDMLSDFSCVLNAVSCKFFFNSVTKRDKIQPVSERREDQVYKYLVCLRSTKHSQSTVV